MLCWQCWKTAAVYQKMAMLVEWDKDENIKLAPLKPVIEIAGSTSTSFAYSTFGSRLARTASEMVHWGKWESPLFQ